MNIFMRSRVQLPSGGYSHKFRIGLCREENEGKGFFRFMKNKELFHTKHCDDTWHHVVHNNLIAEKGL